MDSLLMRRAFGALVIASVVESAAYADFTTFVDVAAVPLRLDSERVAFWTREAPERVCRAEPLGALGPPTPHAIQGWYVAAVQSPAAGRDEASMRDLCSRLGSVPDVFVSPRLIDPEGGEVFVTSDLLVRFADGVSVREALESLAATGAGELLDRDWCRMPGVYRWRCATGDGFEVLARAAGLAALPDVRFAEPDFVQTGKYLAQSNDPGFATNWGLNNVGQIEGNYDVDLDALEAWDLTLGKGITVVVFDGGVDPGHPDLNLTTGEDFTGEGSLGAPNNACDVHGTPVAGCIVARLNNGIGTVGVAPWSVVASARIASSTVPCNGTFATKASWFVLALDWAESVGARVTNSSLQINVPSSALSLKFQTTKNAGMIHFAAAGNTGTAVISYPASLPAVNSISAIDPSGALANFEGGCLNWAASSSYGVGLDFAAPGEDVYTTDLAGGSGYSTGDYVCIDGGSFASPMAAGVGALVLSVAPELSPFEVEAILAQTATDLGAAGIDTSFGNGLPRAHAAVVAALTRDRRYVLVDGPSHVFEAWSAGDAIPAPVECTLSVGGDPSQPIAWSASVTGASFVQAFPASGSLSAARPNAALSIQIDPSTLSAGVHRAVVRVVNDNSPAEVHEIPITFSIGSATFDVGDKLAGALADATDVDSALFQGVIGETLALKLAPTTVKQKVRVTVRQVLGGLPEDDPIEKSFVVKAKKSGAKWTSIKLLRPGLHAVDVAYVSGVPSPYTFLTKRKKLPPEALSRTLVKFYPGAGLPAFFDLSALPGTPVTFDVTANQPMAKYAFDLRTPLGDSVATHEPPAYVNGISLAQTVLGDAGAWKLAVLGLEPGAQVKVVTTLAPPAVGFATVPID